MKKFLCILVAVALCTCCWGAKAKLRPAAPKEKEPERPLIQDVPDDSELPMTPPSALENTVKATPPVPVADGSSLVDLPAQPVRDASGWWTVKEPRAGVARMLPCELLDETLRVMREQPKEKLLLSGELYVYKGNYYFLLRKTDFAQPPAPAPTPAPAQAPSAKVPSAASRPGAAASQPASKGAHSEEVARAMLRENPAKPVLPYRITETPKSAFEAITPARKPLKAGPERIVASRIVRLQGPDAQGWYRVAFEADNTLQDPPLRLMPCALLEQLEKLDARKGAFSRLYYISGETLQSGDHAYLLPREVRLKLDLNEF